MTPQKFDNAIRNAREHTKNLKRQWETENQQTLDFEKNPEILNQINNKTLNSIDRFFSDKSEFGLMAAVKDFLKNNPLSTVEEALLVFKQAGEEFAPEGSEIEQSVISTSDSLRRVSFLLENFKQAYLRWYTENFPKIDDKEIMNKTLLDPFRNPPIKNENYYEQGLNFLLQPQGDEQEEKLRDQYKILELDVINNFPEAKALSDEINQYIEDQKSKSFMTRDLNWKSKLEKLEKQYEKLIKPLRETALIIFSYALAEIFRKKEEETSRKKEIRNISAHRYAMAKIIANFRRERSPDKKVTKEDIDSAFYDIVKNNRIFQLDKEAGAPLIPYSKWLKQNNASEIDKIYKEYLDFKQYQKERKRKKELEELAGFFQMTPEEFSKLPPDEQQTKYKEYYFAKDLREGQVNPMKIIMQNWRKNL